jgi:GTPase SAR1 family protein
MCCLCKSDIYEWKKEIAERAPNVPIILVATKIDLRNEELTIQQNGDLISKQDGTR